MRLQSGALVALVMAPALAGAAQGAAPAPVAAGAAASLGSFDRRSEWAWAPVNIGAGGFVRGMVIHPLLGGAIRYARADTFGAYRWDSLGQRWINMVSTASFPASLQIGTSRDATALSSLTAAPNEGGVDSIAIDPRNANRVYLAMSISPPGDVTGGVARQGNVYFSRNRGRTFAAARGLSLPSYTGACPAVELDGQNSVGERLGVDPRNSNIVWLGSRLNGVFASADAGESFAGVSVPGVPGLCQSVINVLFDGRATVTRRVGGRLQKVSRNIYLVVDAETGSGVYRSDDGGASFVNIAAGRGEFGRDTVRGSAVGADGSFWVIAGGAVLRWRDGVWTASRPPHTGESIVVDPANANRAFVTDGLQISRTSDGGASWTDLGDYLSITSADGIDWITARRVHPTAHGALLFDPSVSTLGGRGRLWAPEGNDGTIFADLDDATQTGPGRGLAWHEQSRGIEQLVGQNIVLPPGSGNVAILTAEDEALFTVTNPRRFNARRYDVDTAAVGNNDLATNGMAAFIPDTPAVLVTNPANLFAGGYRGGAFRNNFAGYSVNSGRNWALFPSIRITTGDNSFGGGSITNNPEALVGGQIAISARGSVLPGRGEARWTGQDNIVWFPFGSSYGYFGATNVPPHYSLDGGASWQASSVFDAAGNRVDFSQNPFQLIFTSAAKQFAVVADPVTPKTFYALTVSNFMVSSDGGATFRTPAGADEAFRYRSFFINAKLEAVPGRAGDLWLSSGPGDPSTGGYLYHSVDGGQHWTRLPLAKAYAVAVGKGAPGGGYALYIYGQPDTAKPWGVYRSDDQGVNWALISGQGSDGYPIGSFNTPAAIAASQDVEGLVYVSFTGMSYAYGYMRQRGNPYPAK